MDIYLICKLFLYLILRIFFSEIEVIGRENIPATGPFILVGNHQNQFVDPMLILTHTRRKLGFLIAAKSMKKRIVGWFATKLHSIPVARARDMATKGKGTVNVNGKHVYGNGTTFTKDFQKGFSIILPNDIDGTGIVEVVSDTELIVRRDETDEEYHEVDYEILPKLDYSQVYQEVWSRLGGGECIGIFPEGGSHDRTELLPLKAGVSLMALGAMEKYGTQVQIIPCGLNYFSGHRFRSCVVIEFGKPYKIPFELVDMYKKDRRKACSELLEKTRELLFSVTLNTPDYDSMRVIHAARKMYQPTNVKLSSEQYMELNRRFAEAYAKFQHEEEIKVWSKRVKDYLHRMDLLGIRDEHVAEEDNVESNLAFLRLVNLKILAMIFFIALSGPGIILNIPIGLIAKIISSREAVKAKSKSIVKIHGTDVIASFKLIIGLVVTPILYFIYTLLIWHFFGLFTGLFFLMVWPWISYASLRVVEEGVHIWKSLRSVLRIKWAGDELKALRQERRIIQSFIRAIVEKWGPKMGKEVWDNRIVTPEDIINEKNDEKDKKSTVYRVRQRHKPYVSQQEKLKETENIIEESQEDLEKELMFADEHFSK